MEDEKELFDLILPMELSIDFKQIKLLLQLVGMEEHIIVELLLIQLQVMEMQWLVEQDYHYQIDNLFNFIQPECIEWDA